MRLQEEVRLIRTYQKDADLSDHSVRDYSAVVRREEMAVNSHQQDRDMAKIEVNRLQQELAAAQTVLKTR